MSATHSYSGLGNEKPKKAENVKKPAKSAEEMEQRCVALESVIGELKSSMVDLQLKYQRQGVELAKANDMAMQSRANSSFHETKAQKVSYTNNCRVHSAQLHNLNMAHKRSLEECKDLKRELAKYKSSSSPPEMSCRRFGSSIFLKKRAVS